MSNSLEKGVCDKNKTKKKRVCDHCGVCRFCDALPVCILKNHICYQNKIRYRFTPQSFSNNNQSDVSDIEQNKIKLNITTIYHIIDITSLIDELNSCDDRNILLINENLLKIGNSIGVEARNYNEIPNNGFNMKDMELERRKSWDPRIYSNHFKIKFLTSSV